MNLHAAVWLFLFLLFACLTFRRSSWGIPLYMLSTYFLPAGWWWGDGLLSSVTTRWSLVAALILAAGVVLDRRPRHAERSARAVLCLLALYALNATVVHLTVGDDTKEAWSGFADLLKQTALVFVLLAAIKDKFDLRMMIYSILLCSAFIGVDVVFAGAGSGTHGRLESIRAAGANEANGIASLLTIAVPLGGYLLFCGSRLEKCVAVVPLVLVLEVIIRCVSRGALFGLIGGGAWLVFMARGRFRRYAVAGVLLAATAGLVQTRGGFREFVVNRFFTTFVSDEERDVSSQTRLEYWRQGVKMVSDYPFGSGYYAAFRSTRGLPYLSELGIHVQRSVHNGYIDVAASWGVQGLVLFLAALGVAWWRLRTSTSRVDVVEGPSRRFLGLCLEATLVTQLIVAMFGSTLGAEWNWWWIAMATSVHVGLGPPLGTEEEVPRHQISSRNQPVSPLSAGD